MTSLITELELIIADAGEAHEFSHNLKVVSVSALESLIESAKKEMQEPVAYIHRNEYNEYRLEPKDNLAITDFPLNVDVDLFTHPPLSDETVKDAAIGKLVREKMKSGNDVPVSRCTISRNEFDEAMKAANEK